MGKGLIVIIILVLLAVVLFGQYIGVKNTLVTKNEDVKAKWSQVDIALQRRALPIQVTRTLIDRTFAVRLRPPRASNLRLIGGAREI